MAPEVINYKNNKNDDQYYNYNPGGKAAAATPSDTGVTILISTSF